MRRVYPIVAFFVVCAFTLLMGIGAAPAEPAPTLSDGVVDQVEPPEYGETWELPACGMFLPGLDQAQVCQTLVVDGWFTVDFHELPGSYQGTLWVKRPGAKLWTIIDTIDWNDFPGWVSAIFETKLKIWSAGEYRLRLRISDQDGTECVSNLAFWTKWSAAHCLQVSLDKP